MSTSMSSWPPTIPRRPASSSRLRASTPKRVAAASAWRRKLEYTPAYPRAKRAVRGHEQPAASADQHAAVREFVERAHEVHVRARDAEARTRPFAESDDERVAVHPDRAVTAAVDGARAEALGGRVRDQLALRVALNARPRADPRPSDGSFGNA